MTNQTTTHGDAALLQVNGLVKEFEIKDAALRSRTLRAVDGVDFVVRKKETFAIVGESGSGKSTIGRVLLGLAEKSSGDILFDSKPLSIKDRSQFRHIRKRLQIVFQDPVAAFDPRISIGKSLMEFLELRDDLDLRKRRQRAEHLISEVGLVPEMINRLPSQMSGGQLQRLSIARALASEPELIFLDEPTSALDVSIRGQIVNLLLERQKQHSVSYLLVAHDLRVVAVMADQVAVMYLGQFVEVSEKDQLFSHPLHPYTRGLIEAAHLDDLGLGRETDTVKLSGELSEDDAKSMGCRLAPRCPFAESKCSKPQELVELKPGQFVRCWKALSIEGVPGHK
ncbi:MAG: peptide ABC transporter substrate-binding protein [Acidiferrobacteraceae bacterium]|nr:peptide ABC transporter substrate-binding protein [Acidiferrobacteraceae bacterium]|tara:strand:+ start:3101 stop:4117 length:1017 start_codon:yes stop_codon:yes gene_type:complete